MDKFEHMIILWTFAPMSKGIRLIDPSGNETKHEIRSGFMNPNTGEKEFLEIVNQLGSLGWELFEVTTIDYGRDNFTSRAYLKRRKA